MTDITKLAERWRDDNFCVGDMDGYTGCCADELEAALAALPEWKRQMLAMPDGLWTRIDKDDPATWPENGQECKLFGYDTLSPPCVCEYTPERLEAIEVATGGLWCDMTDGGLHWRPILEGIDTPIDTPEDL